MVGPKVNIGSGVKVQNNMRVLKMMVFTNPRAFIVRREEFKKDVVSEQMPR